ncbi:MAG: HAMP domain-containing histidine kinase [Brevinematales bacterium]|nr:HAMP domain-containing histidine kinase [Brevinematales bacterium]
MKVRFYLIFIIASVVILTLSIYTSYISIYNHQKLLEKELWKIGKIAENNIEIQKRLSLFKVFSEKMVVETTRKVWFMFLLNILLLLSIFGIYIIGVVRPIYKLSKKVNSIYFEQGIKDIKIKEQGTEEVRLLIKAFNEMFEKLKNYENVVGNIQKYRGWKEISRVLVHEINNILSPVQTYLEYLMDEVEDTKKITMILSKISEIKEILNRLREFSHFPDPVFQEYSIVSLLKEVTLEFKNVEFTDSIDYKIRIDPLLTKEILRNLIKNALESKENVSVKISFEEEKNYVKIKVEDNGPGISKENLEKIFSPGFSTKKKKGNIGIGLSIVQSLIQEQHGIISVESEVGKGTIFNIYFPLNGGINENTGS